MYKNEVKNALVVVRLWLRNLKDEYVLSLRSVKRVIAIVNVTSQPPHRLYSSHTSWCQ